MSDNKYDLFIRIYEGIPVFFPSTRENIVSSHPGVDLDNPELSKYRFEKAKQVPHPDEWIALEYKVWEELPYTFDGEYWVNSWVKRDMTDKERYETDIMAEVGNRRDKQIAKYLKSVGIDENASQEVQINALNEAGPEYVFSLDVD